MRGNWSALNAIYEGNLNWFVRIDHLTDKELEFFGYYKVEVGAEFSTYLHVRYNEPQPVSNAPPRFLVVDDFNDAAFMTRGSEAEQSVIKGPDKPD